jgi:P27 family predicted phage terminase small subunit
MRGRRPMPTALRALRGTEGGKPVAGVEPVETPCPGCPDWLSEDAKAEWARLAGGLHGMGRLTPEDVATFAAYCAAYASFKLYNALATSEPMVEGSQGQMRVNPAAQAADNALKQVHRFALEFGLSPAARGRFDIPVENGERDEFDGF